MESANVFRKMAEINFPHALVYWRQKMKLKRTFLVLCIGCLLAFNSGGSFKIFALETKEKQSFSLVAKSPILFMAENEEDDAKNDNQAAIESGISSTRAFLEKNVNIAGFNLNYPTASAYFSDGSFNPVFRTSHYQTYRNPVISAFSSLNSDSKEALENLSTSVPDIANLLTFSTAKYDIAETQIINYTDIAASSELRNSLIGRATFGQAKRAVCPFLSSETVLINSPDRSATRCGLLGEGVATIYTLSEALASLGLSAEAIATIKGSFFAIIELLKAWLPKLIKIALITAAIAAITIVLICYWNQICEIFDVLVNVFISAAQSFLSFVLNIFESIREEAEKSLIEAYYQIEGAMVGGFILSQSKAIALARRKGDWIFWRAYRISDVSLNLQMVFLDPRPIIRGKAVLRLHVGLDVYTPANSAAESIAKDASPVGGAIYHSAHNVPDNSSVEIGWNFDHYHCLGMPNNLDPHSFFGLPKVKAKAPAAIIIGGC